MEKECPCGKKFWCPHYAINRKKYCSKRCFYKYRKIPIWNKGLKGIHLSPKTEFKKGFKPWNVGLKDEQTGGWKGDKIGYFGIHDWVERQLGKPKKCEHCGTIKKKIYHWSNKYHKYNRRKLSDWQCLCIKCHFIYDKQKFGTRKNFHR